MTRVIAVEGCLAAGKTSLTRFLSRRFGVPAVFERHELNPFLEDFYAHLRGENSTNPTLETELAFLLLHAYDMRRALQNNPPVVFADYAMIKDLVYARMNLHGDQLQLFEDTYRLATQGVPAPSMILLLDVNIVEARRRILQRGRPYELDVRDSYFDDYAKNIATYLECNESATRRFDVNGMRIDENDSKYQEIEDLIRRHVNGSS